MVYKYLMSWLCISISVTAWAMPTTVPAPGTVTLTFDDGPSPIYTPQILKILQHYKVHAVFFVMGGLAKQQPQLLRKIIADGNVVASHTMTHPKLTHLSATKLNAEIAHSKQVIQAIIGKPPACLRPPFFLSNTAVTQAIQHHGMIKIMGYMTEDYRNRGVPWLVQHVLSQIKPGMILVFHDGYKGRQQTVAALPAIIEGIKQRGIGFSVICK